MNKVNIPFDRTKLIRGMLETYERELNELTDQELLQHIVHTEAFKAEAERLGEKMAAERN